MIILSEKKLIVLLTGFFVIFQCYLSIELYKEGVQSHSKILSLLEDSNHKINTLNEITVTPPSAHIALLKKESVTSMLKLSSKETYCTKEEDFLLALRFTENNNIKLWKIKNSASRVKLSEVPTSYGTIFMHGNSLLALLYDSSTELILTSHRIDHLLMGDKGNLSGFKVDGRWFSNLSCKKNIIL